MKETKAYVSIFIIFFLIFVMVGCSKNQSITSVDSPVSLPYKDFLDIRELSEGEKIRKSNLDLGITNKSNDCVLFPYDYGVQIFALIDNIWKEVPNIVEYPNKTEIILSTTSEGLSDAIVYITPDYSTLNESPRTVRVIMNANLCKNGIPTDERVIDYIDIDLGKQ